MTTQYNKNYHFFKKQLYGFIYTEDQNEIKELEEDSLSQYSSHPQSYYPPDSTKGDTFYGINLFLKTAGICLTMCLPLLLLLLIPGFNIALFLGLTFLIGIAGCFVGLDAVKYNKRPCIYTDTEGQRSLWLQRPTSFLGLPSLLVASLRTTAWLHDMVAAVPRLVRYYLRKGTTDATFEDPIKRGGAWGSLLGSICTIGAVVTVGLLLMNPYTLIGITAIAALIVASLFIVPRIVKGFEFLGRLAGTFYTKKLVEQELNNIEMAQQHGTNLQRNASVSEEQNSLTGPVPPREEAKPLPIFRSTAQICKLAFQDCIKPRNFAGRQSAARIIFHPQTLTSHDKLFLNKKGLHLESQAGKDLFKTISPSLLPRL